jgi:hypothetical protein
MIPLAIPITTTPPISPCGGGRTVCVGASITIAFDAGDINAAPATSVAIYASREGDPPNLIGILFAQIFQSSGQYTLNNLLSDTMYKITLINNFQQSSQALFIKTPKHGSDYLYIPNPPVYIL